MKTIDELDISKINDSHLICLKAGHKMYRRVKGNPLEFHYNDTTFTTSVLPEDRHLDMIGIDSGNYCTITTIRGAFAETNWEEGRRLFEVVVIKPIDRILDLDRICEEQSIERRYLHTYNTIDGRDREKERRLFKLYGEEISKRRIRGIKYRSRRSPEDTCYMFYDTIPELNDYLSYKEIPDENKVNTYNLLKNCSDFLDL